MIHDCDYCEHELEPLMDLQVRVEVYDPNQRRLISLIAVPLGTTTNYRPGVPIIRPNGEVFNGLYICEL